MATLKQKLAADKIIENHGNVSKTMREVGYSNVSAMNPRNLTDSKAWEQLLEERFGDDFLTARHNKLIKSKNEEVSLRSIVEAYKLKKKYPADKLQVEVENPLEDIQKIRERNLRLEEELKQLTSQDDKK